jgi:hypothetical protein
MMWAKHLECVGETRNALKILVGKLEGNRPIGRPRCRWEDNNNMDPQRNMVGLWIGYI